LHNCPRRLSETEKNVKIVVNYFFKCWCNILYEK
jgi:hypothetical protein